MSISKFYVCLTSTAIVFGCVSITYYYLQRNKNKIRNESDKFNYLNIRIITNVSESDEVVLELERRCKLHRAIGFDCEWVTEHGKRNPVALLQLSTFDGYCALFRLNHLKFIPNSLKDLLEDKRIYKVGVAPVDDASFLYQDYCVSLKGTLDVRHIANLCKYGAGGLASLSKEVLGVELDKSWRVRCSNWEAEVLTDKQVKYAAADAHVAVRIFARLIDDLNRKSVGPLLRGEHIDIWNDLDKVCWQFCDIQYKMKNSRHAHDTVDKDKKSSNKEALPFSKRYPNSTRCKPLYHNCFLQAPDGELLCTCDRKKAIWYLDKGLADIVKREPLTVRLRFEPAGRSVGDVGKYYQLTKENKCVVCGATNSYIRKNVVPREYRKYFPEIMKDHSSHDVVLLCVRCHQRSNTGDQRVRDSLAAMCSAPLASRHCTRYTEDATGKKIRSAARALLYQTKKHTLPEYRRRALENVVLQHYPQHVQITLDLLKEAAEMQVVTENEDYECHGLKVVEWFTGNEGGLLRLEEMWREHFLDSMRPLYMPDLWSVKHNEERLRVRLKEGRLSEEDMKLIGGTMDINTENVSPK